jgi:regulatory protein
MYERPKKKISPQESLTRIYRYCAYQERSHKEVRNKLFEFGLRNDEVDDLVTRLVLEGYLNEERFAKAFTGGKFRMQKWGRNKIVYALEGHGLTQNCIQSGLREIDEPDYRQTLADLVAKKLAQTDAVDVFLKRDKVARFAIARGFEPELVWETVKRLQPS